MSRAELIAIVDQSSPEDRLFLQAYVEHLNRISDPENGRNLDRRLDAMRCGREISLDDVRRIHDELSTKGL